MKPWKNIANLSKSQSLSLQGKKLNDFINHYIYPFSPFYRKMFDENKIDPKSIKSVDDLKRIPFTSKLDFICKENPTQYKDFVLQPDQDKIKKAWPARKLMGLACDKFIKGKDYLDDKLSSEFRPSFMTFTTGTTNDPVPFVYSGHDMQNLNISGSRMLKLFGIEQSEKIVNMFPFAPHLAFWQVVNAGLASNTLILSTGGGKAIGTEGNLSAILKMKPTVILGVPSYVYHVLRLASERNCDFSFIKKVVLGASRITIPFKQKLASLLNNMGASDVSVFGTYGFTEARCAWAEAPTKIDVSSGYHLYTDKEIFEVIDPKTGEVVAEGEDGELVYTSIDSRGSCVIRYRTGDFVKGGITYEKSPYTDMLVPRISSDITRLSDVKDLNLSKVKGQLVNLSNFDVIMSEIEPLIEWQLVLKKKNDDPFDVDEIVLYACVQDTCNKEKVVEDINNKMKISTELMPNKIEFVSLEEIVGKLEIETANKEKRILDKRPKD